MRRTGTPYDRVVQRVMTLRGCEDPEAREVVRQVCGAIGWECVTMDDDDRLVVQHFGTFRLLLLDYPLSTRGYNRVVHFDASREMALALRRRQLGEDPEDAPGSINPLRGVSTRSKDHPSLYIPDGWILAALREAEEDREGWSVLESVLSELTEMRREVLPDLPETDGMRVRARLARLSREGKVERRYVRPAGDGANYYEYRLTAEGDSAAADF